MRTPDEVKAEISKVAADRRESDRRYRHTLETLKAELRGTPAPAPFVALAAPVLVEPEPEPEHVTVTDNAPPTEPVLEAAPDVRDTEPPAPAHYEIHREDFESPEAMLADIERSIIPADAKPPLRAVAYDWALELAAAAAPAEPVEAVSSEPARLEPSTPPAAGESTEPPAVEVKTTDESGEAGSATSAPSEGV